MRPPRLSLDRATAHTCLVMNLLVLPGLGTFLAGRRVAGSVQAILALMGLGFTLFGFVTFILNVLHPIAFDAGPHLVAVVVGMALFTGAWLWALLTGRVMLRAVST